MGYAYHLETESDFQAIYGKRTVVKATKLSDGSVITMLGGNWTASRYSIDNWKLVGNKLHFSGFDNVNSNVVTGEIDTLLLRLGKTEAEYLKVTQAGSAIGATAKINDYEVVKASAPEGFTGGNPSITKIFTNEENVYSASVEFSKYMNHESVANGLTVTDETNIDTITNLPKSVDSMKVWLGRTLHLIFDTLTPTPANPRDVNKAYPLAYGTSYKIAVSGKVMDREGIDLETSDLWPGTSSMNPVAEKTATLITRPESGWFISENVRAQNIPVTVTGNTTGETVTLSDGYYGRYVRPTSSSGEEKYFTLATGNDLQSSNFKIEFTMQSKGQSNNTFRLAIKDAKVIDWNNVDWANLPVTDTNGNEWQWVDGYYQDVNGGRWTPHWDGATEYWVDHGQNGLLDSNIAVTTSAPVLAGDDTVYTWIEGYEQDKNGDRYISFWDQPNQQNKLQKLDANNNVVATYIWEHGHYLDDNGTPSDTNDDTKYTAQYGSWYDNSIPAVELLDFSTVAWVDGGYFDSSGVRQEIYTSWVSGFYTKAALTESFALQDANRATVNIGWGYFDWKNGNYTCIDAGATPNDCDPDTSQWEGNSLTWISSLNATNVPYMDNTSTWDGRLFDLNIVDFGGDYSTIGVDTTWCLKCIQWAASIPGGSVPDLTKLSKHVLTFNNGNMIYDVYTGTGEKTNVLNIPVDLVVLGADKYSDNTTVRFEDTTSGFYGVDLVFTAPDVLFDDVMITELNIDGTVNTSGFSFSEDFGAEPFAQRIVAPR